MSTYTVKTRTERRPRALVAIKTTAPTVDVRLVLAEETVYIAELFKDGDVVESGEGSTKREAYASLGTKMRLAGEKAVNTILERAEALNIARNAEVPR